MRRNHKNHIGSLCGLSLLYVATQSKAGRGKTGQGRTGQAKARQAKASQGKQAMSLSDVLIVCHFCLRRLTLVELR